MPGGENVVNPRAAARLADHVVPEAGGEHPLVQALSGVPEGGLQREPLSRAEAIERDREVVDMNLGHAASSIQAGRWSSFT